MRGAYLGEFEELVLLMVGVLYTNAYAVAITNEISSHSGRNVHVSAVHKALYRLESKGFLTSGLGEIQAKRGGKRKRIFSITPSGKQVLDDTMKLRLKLRNQISDLAFNWQQK